MSASRGATEGAASGGGAGLAGPLQLGADGGNVGEPTTAGGVVEAELRRDGARRQQRELLRAVVSGMAGTHGPHLDEGVS